MSNYIEEWKMISARINGLEKSVHIYSSLINTKHSDEYKVINKAISPEYQSIVESIKQFNEQYESFLPHSSKLAIDEFLSHHWQNKSSDHISKNWVSCCQAIIPIFTFQSKFDYLLKNTESKIRNITELAFEHLRRTIVVNDDIGIKWREKDELTCEKLGSIHLLSHGIWAFKIHGEKGRTDLVYGDPIENHIDTISRSAQGLILTEWKIATNKTLDEKAREAREQMKLYAGGILNKIELKKTRYVILITENDAKKLDDIYESDIQYRHIIIATNPLTPSQQSKKK